MSGCAGAKEYELMVGWIWRVQNDHVCRLQEGKKVILYMEINTAALLMVIAFIKGPIDLDVGSFAYI